MASETSAIALQSEEIRKEMPVATASGGGVANLSHDLLFILLYFIKKNCMQRNRFYNGIVSEIKLFTNNGPRLLCYEWLEAPHWKVRGRWFDSWRKHIFSF